MKAKAPLTLFALMAAIGVITWQHWEITNLRDQLAEPLSAKALAAKTNAAKLAVQLALAKSLGSSLADIPLGSTSLEVNKATLARILAEPDDWKRHRAQDLFTGSLNPSSARALLEAVMQMPESSEIQHTRKQLVTQWARTNPTQALDWAKAQTNPSDRSTFLWSVFDVMGYTNPLAALAELAKPENASERILYQANILGDMAERDPQNALATLNSMPANQQSAENYGSIFKLWSERDPAGAAAAAQAMPQNQASASAIQQVARSWAQQDPQSAIAWVTALPPGDSRNQALSSALEATANTDPATAASLMSALPNGDDRNHLIQNIAQNWAQTDPAATLNWLGTVATGQAYNTAIEDTLRQLGQVSPNDAASFLAQVKDPEVLSEAIPQLASDWAATDVQSALAWAQSLPYTSGNPRSDALVGIINGWASTDLASSAAYVQNMVNDPDFSALADQITRTWGATNPQAALAWAQSLPAGDGQNNAMATAIGIIAKTDPQTAITDAIRMPPGDIQDAAINRVYFYWSAQDPVQAAESLSSISADQQTVAARSIAGTWSQHDPTATAQWIDTLPEGAPHDAAAQQWVVAESHQYKQEAFTMATTINNPDFQSSTLHGIVSNWAQEDLPAAMAAIQSANISDSLRSDLLKAANALAPPVGTAHGFSILQPDETQSSK